MGKKSILEGAVVRWDELENRPRKITGRIEVAQKRRPEDTVRAFFTDNKNLFKLNSDKKNLRLIQNVESSIGRHLRFQQFISGIPVYGGIVAVHFDKQGKIKQVNDDHELDSRLAPVDGVKKVTSKEATKIARDSISKPIKLRAKTKVETSQYYFPTVSGLKKSWCVTISTINPLHDWRIFVDAYTGKILAKNDEIDFAVDGEGLIFNPNPVVTANDNTLTEGVTAEATLNAERETGALLELEDPVGGLHYLRGPYVEIVNLAAPAIGIPAEADPADFNYERTDDNFEAVMVYHHIDSYQRYIHDVLGITTACPATPPDTRIHADPHDDTHDYAWFSGSTLDLHFSNSGPGVPDRAEDGDCMLHEYGHAILKHQVPGWHAEVPGVVPVRYEARAIGEGFGDVSTCIYFAQAGDGYQREVFEDWIFGPGGLRRVDNPTDYDGFLTGANNHYANSEIWSGSIWDIFLAMGGDSPTPADWEAPRDTLLKALITSHQLYTASESMPDAAEALLDTHCELNDQLGRQAVEMLDVFHDRKLLECNIGSDIRVSSLWSQQDNLSIRSWEEVEAGQDNWFYAEITNSGASDARALVVTFSFKCPFSTPVYPADFRDNIISATVEFDLAAGETRTVTARWPSDRIPAIPTGADSLHGCMFAEVYNPVDHVPAGATTIGASNGKLRYTNTTIKDLVPDADADFIFNMSSFHVEKEQLARLEVIRPPKFSDMEIALHHYHPDFIKKFWDKTEVIAAKSFGLLEKPIKTDAELRLLEPAKFMMSSKTGKQLLLMNLAKGSTLMIPEEGQDGDRAAAVDPDFFRRDADLIKMKNETFLKLHPGKRVGLPYRMKPRDRAMMKLRIKAPKNAKPGEQFKVEVVQHNMKKELIGGFDVQINIVKATPKQRKPGKALPKRKLK